MNSKDNKRMCAAMDYNHDLYDDDCYNDILNILDFPVESLEGDGLTEDWAGPIPSEVFREMLPPAGPADLLKLEPCEPKYLKTETSDFSQEKKLLRIPKFFDSPSPDSVLQSRSSSSTEKTKSISFGTQITTPIRTRTKRSKSKSKVNPWSRSLQGIPLQTIKKMKRKKRNVDQQAASEMKKCSHCEITKSPQWREGPMGPKTLCNACGVRYRSGRLFPEYRPAASPTFIPALHSNSHRKVIEMRQRGAKIEDHNYALKSNSTDNNRLCSNSADNGLCS